jgi:glucose-1-phosphate thymidylyltransferase
MGYIDRDTCYRLGSHLAKSPYGQYIMEVTETG